MPSAVLQESLQGSSDETVNSGEEGSSSGRSEASSNEAGSSRASQSAGSPGSELHSDDMADSEALKEEEDEEEEDDDEDDEDDDDDDDDDRPIVASEGSPQKETRDSREAPTSELRKRKAGEALGEVQGPPERPGIPPGMVSGPGLSKPKSIPFTPEAAAAMIATSSSSLRILEPCSSSSMCLEGTSGEQADPSSHSQNPQQPQQEMGVSQEPPCLPRASDFLTEAMSNELFNCRRFISPQHHHHHHHHHHHQHDG